MSTHMLTFQQIIQKLLAFWEKEGCIIHQGHDLEMGAGTFNPATFLRCLGPEPYKTAYIEPSRRPSDGRFGENPNRLQLFHQLQVVIKPSPVHILDMYKRSLLAIGINLKKHDVRFVHDDWESPTLGAFGLGWEVWIDGMEVTQITYFQAVASLALKPISVEISYGLERLCMYVQNKDSFFDMKWNAHYTFGDICKRNEIEWSAYNFTYASTEMWFRHFDDYEMEAKRLISKELPLPAYDFVIKASHAFNMLEARGVISVTERTGYIARIRDLARLIASSYLVMREKEGFPLMKNLSKEKIVSPKAKHFPKSFHPSTQKDFVLEIGSEELPAAYIPIGMQNLEKAFHALFQKHNLSFKKIQAFGTPRRLGVFVQGLSEGTEDTFFERKGPSIANAFEKDGSLTKQGKGFFKAIGIESITRKELEKRKEIEVRAGYLFATIKKKGESVYQILADALPELIVHLEFPKKMRWGFLDIVYPRPIQWIVALYGNCVIPFVLGNVASDRFSYGHSQLSPKKLPLKEVKTFFTILHKHKVMALVAEREQKILVQLQKLEKKLKGQALEKQKVLSQVLHLTEWPTLTYATFDKQFLTLPPEVLISEMVEHQKYFPLAQKKALKPAFILTADNTVNSLIRKGNQKVLSARLSDGMFLYTQDLSIPLNQWNQKLEKILFQKELGSLKEKVLRIVTLSQKLNDILHLAEEKKVLRAAKLCKADLASHMVKEFPHLQGTIGKYYALAQKEDPEVALAIEEHWMPREEGGKLPQSNSGKIVSLADKLDNLVQYFCIGLKPTASSDPFALRRQTIGMIKLLIENTLSFDLREFVNEEVLIYITARSFHIFEEYGFAKDEIEALGLCYNPYEQYCKIQALHAFRKENSFDKLLEVYKRAKGQLEKGRPGSFDPIKATEPAEKELIKALKTIEKNLPHFLTQKNYTLAFQELSKLHLPLAHLFDTVKILAEDSTIKENRLALLHHVLSHFHELLDFSKLQVK